MDLTALFEEDMRSIRLNPSKYRIVKNLFENSRSNDVKEWQFEVCKKRMLFFQGREIRFMGEELKKYLSGKERETLSHSCHKCISDEQI